MFSPGMIYVVDSTIKLLNNCRDFCVCFPSKKEKKLMKKKKKNEIYDFHKREFILRMFSINNQLGPKRKAKYATHEQEIIN